MCDVPESYTIGAKYRAVKKRLDCLGYKQSLSLDSISLVEQLLADLIKTTESLKYYKSVAANNIENRNPQTSFKLDGSLESNKIHDELIQCKENHLKVTKELKKKIQRLENECADLQLASSRNLKKIKDLETESANKSKRIQELLGKCCKPTVSNALGNKKRAVFPLRKPVLEADELPVDASDNNRYLNLSTPDQRTVDLVSMADRKISSLNHEVLKLKAELSQQKDNIHTYREQLSLKDKELYRLKKMLETRIGSCTCRKNERCIECNDGWSGQNKFSEINEVRVLQQAKLNLEQQLRDALDKQHDAMTQAMKLAERNEELEKELKDIDHIALAVEADCNSTVKENNKRVSQLQEKFENAMTQIHQLETNLLGEKRTSQELRADLESCRVEKRNIQRKLEEVQEENRQLKNRVNDLELIDKRASNDKANGMSKQIADKDDKIKQLEKTIQQLERDKNYYREEWNKLSSQRKDADTTELWSQICELKQQLNEKEVKITELQRERKELAREKFELENKLQTCRSLGSCGCYSTDNGSKISLMRVERERDSARADAERLIEERDILRERLKLATEAHTSEQRRLRERLRDLELKLEEVEREKHNFVLSQESRRSALTGLEDQLEDAKEELRRTKQELAAQRTQYFQLRALQDQTDQALGDVQSQLHQSEAELAKAVERNRNLEQQQVQLNNQVKDQKQEINTLRSSMARLDREKDQLLMELDEKTEKISALEREVVLKEQQTNGIEQQLRDLQHKNQICMDTSAEQERQLRNMQMELENNNRQLAGANADRDNAVMENRRLQDDLAAVTCEIRTLQRELEASRAESHDLKRQLQTYVSEVRRAEELLNRKENERTEMLNHFRSLSLEATVLENNNHSLESEAAEARGALQSARDRLIDLERQLADKDCLIHGYEAQITELTQNVASLETQVRQQLELRKTAETDLNAVRDLCVQLDQQKESLKKEIIDKESLIVQYETKLSRVKVEQNLVQDQKSRDYVTIDRLQMLLDQARRESVECQKNNQELLNEIDRMKQRINDLQNKLSSESAELKRCQNQAAEYSNQIADLRRKVTDERFNRARKEEEHRRNYNYDQMHMAGEPAQSMGISPTRVDFSSPQELGTNLRLHDGPPGASPPRSNRTNAVTHKDRDDVDTFTDMESFIINYQQEAPSEQQDGGPPNSQDGGHPNPQDGGDRNPDGGNLNFQNSAGNLNLQKSAGNSKKRKLSFLPCGKSCGPDDKVTPCPGSKRDKSIGTNTDGSKKHRKKTQTDKNLLQRPDVVDVEVSVPGLVDESVGVSADQLPDRSGAQQAHDRSGLQQGHSDGSEQNDDAGLQQGHDDAGDQQVDDRPGQPAHDRSRRRDRSRPEEDGDPQEHDGGSGRNKRGSKKKSTSPEAVPGPSGLQKKSNKSNKDDDCGCTESNKLRGCLVHEEPEPEMDELFDSTGSVVEKTFDDVHNLTRTIQERLDSINETISDARRDSRPVGSRRSGSASFILETSPSTDRVVIEESSTSLVIETSRTPRTRRSSGRPGPSSLEPEPETPQRRIPTPTVPPPLAKAPKKRLVRKTVPQVASAPAASPMRQPVPVSTRTSPVQPEQVQVPSRPSAQVQPRPSPRPPLQSSTRPPPIQTPTRPPPAQSTRPPPVQSPRPGPAEASPRPGPDQVPPRPGPDQVPPRPGPVQAPPRPGPVEVPPRPGSFEAPSRPGPVEAQPRPRPDQGPPRPGPVEVPPRSPAKKSKTKKPPAQCNLSRCHKCPGQSRIPTRPSPHVQFPQILNLLPLHTSSPITSHQTISNPKPSHHYFLRSHAKKVYTTNPTQAGSSQDLPTGATQRRSHSPSGETRRHTSRRRHSRESSSGTSGSSIRITRKKTRKLSTESEYGS
ncbi:centrosomal protein of 135 kDa isoform X2 [Microplitis demolitor]|uniref:centrosomal protein of 135 kDa isoform X2 n=1 Tax=Microplitis demolitor TaxID=69319 RepID=UPI0004CDA059|nr:centrosomal protein of 135 kDa isoform X2 [Microplitis demolitor]